MEYLKYGVCKITYALGNVSKLAKSDVLHHQSTIIQINASGFKGNDGIKQVNIGH